MKCVARTAAILLVLGNLAVMAQVTSPTHTTDGTAARLPGNTSSPLLLSERELPGMRIGYPFHSSIPAMGGVAPFTYTLTGDVPPGISVVQDGKIVAVNGTPTEMGDYSFRVSISDATGATVEHSYKMQVAARDLSPQLAPQNLQITEVITPRDDVAIFYPLSLLFTEVLDLQDSDTVTPKTVAITPTTTPGGTYGVSYSQTFTAGNNTGAASLTPSGTLPTGMSFNGSGTASVTLSGTPTQSGTFGFAIVAEDSASASYIVYSLVIAPPVTVTPGVAPSGNLNVAYSQTFSATQNIGSVTVSPNGGTLPSGMCFSLTSTCPTGRILYGSSLRLIGTPTQAGTFSFTLTAQDTVNTTNVNYTLTIAAATQSITIGTLPSPIYGGSSFTLSASSTSGLPVSIASTSSKATGSNPFSPVGTGSASFQATQSGNANYAAATPVNFNVMIAPATLTLSAFNASRKFGHPNPNFLSLITGYVNGDGSSVVSGTTSNTSAATTLSPVSGSPYAIVPSISDLSATNYVFQAVNGALTITPNSQTITFLKIPDLSPGANYPLTAVASSGLPVTYSFSGPVVISNNTLGVIGTGTVTVTAHQAGNSNYSAATDVARSFTAQ